MKQLIAALFLLTILSAVVSADEYTFTLSDIEKKPYEVGGYLELRPVLFGLDKDAALYKLNFFDRNMGSSREEFNGRLWLEGSLRKGIAGFYLQLSEDYTNSYLGADTELKPYSAYFSIKPSSSLTVNLGKKTSNWGKGYAWNPAAFVDRPKDPDDPQLTLEGFTILSVDYIKSFTGPLKTFSFTPVIMPAYDEVNDDFGDTGHINVAAKAYFLLYDTDIDLMFLAGGSKTARYGFDFSRNIGTNFEVHGEFAYINDFKKVVIDADGNTFDSTSGALNFVLGTRYLSGLNTTYILEYYYQGTGYSSQEMTDYFTFIDKGYDAFLAQGDSRPLAKAASVTKSGYGRFTPEQHYLYLRVSQPEPFDILYFTPALALICNVSDGSFSVTPELLYAPITNLELRLMTGLLVGAEDSEFGEKQANYRLELRVRYYF
jgi:hypothetical protein